MRKGDKVLAFLGLPVNTSVQRLGERRRAWATVGEAGAVICGMAIRRLQKVDEIEFMGPGPGRARHSS
jgi:hypothetical protein